MSRGKIIPGHLIPQGFILKKKVRTIGVPPASLRAVQQILSNGSGYTSCSSKKVEDLQKQY